MSWLFASCAGAIVGLGVFLVVAGARGVEPSSVPGRLRFLSVANRRGLLMRLGLAIGAGTVVLLTTGWIVAAMFAAALGASAQTLFGGAAHRKRALARVEAIAAWTEMLRDVSASGAGIQEAILATSTLALAAIRTEIEVLAVRLERDRLVPALRGFADDVNDPLADLVVAALITASSEQTRNFGELLGSLARAIREQAGMRLRIESGRARTRATAKAVAGISLGSAVGFVILDRGFLAPYDSAVGQLALLVIGACFAGAFFMLARMGRPADLPRLLPAEKDLGVATWS